jgi:hypothetical protein
MDGLYLVMVIVFFRSRSAGETFEGVGGSIMEIFYWLGSIIASGFLFT